MVNRRGVISVWWGGSVFGLALNRLALGSMIFDPWWTRAAVIAGIVGGIWVLLLALLKP